KNPVRLDLFENEIEDIRFFDPISQKTIKKVDEVIILPAREYISENHDADTIPGKYNADSSLLEYLKDPVVIFINKEEVFKEYAKIEKEMKEILGSRYEEYKKLSSIPLSSFEKLFETAKEIEYSFDTKEFHVISPKKKGKTIPILDIEDIKVGDLVVHKDHGIGIFQGVEKVENALGIREYFKIKYADANLYVPVERLDRVHKYIGNSSEISINKLNDKRWKKTVKKIKEDIERKIKELIELYLKRQEVKGLSLPGDPDMEEKLAQTFPYPETPDQKRCIEEVLTDLEDEKPMDRLLCGDSGFGKTEVAIRAAFRTVVSGKQVAILVPTVVLARQHYENFQKRLSPFGVKVALLDSTKTRAERKRIIEGLKKGELDIVIGTHSLLSDDIKFYDLGLIIIDEEQKFGVEQKEKLKKLRVSVNVLSMSATPIPRTLHMALSGMKDLSVINTPPVGRKPIVVYVMEYDPRVVRNAILREVNRGGQVIYVRNRVEELEEVFERLTNLVPEVKIGVAHGRMRKKVMEEIVWDFYKGKLDVLVCTTIIESGVDIPNANTLIVEDSHRYGLAQLYQLRGRVGRSEKRAFAYFLYPKHALKKSLERLKIIKETIGPGSSFEIAMKDMELRGIGSIFGFEQHGNMNSIGFKLYSEILENS
ncbi:MAG TPA: DEAD/DEAH box helicase, partial [Thermotoga sp.]|nr:DEAD/DEAH box helicase [Thermotoga sp.]